MRNALIRRKRNTRVTLDTKVKVIDAANPLYFNVSDNQIYSGQRRNKANCVLACALRERIPSAVTVEVGSRVTKIRYPKKIVRYTTPGLFGNQLKRWDNTGRWALPPGEYHLNRITKSNKLGAQRVKYKKSGPHTIKTKKRRIPGTNLHTNHPTRWIMIAA